MFHCIHAFHVTLHIQFRSQVQHGLSSVQHTATHMLSRRTMSMTLHPHLPPASRLARSSLLLAAFFLPPTPPSHIPLGRLESSSSSACSSGARNANVQDEGTSVTREPSANEQHPSTCSVAMPGNSRGAAGIALLSVCVCVCVCVGGWVGLLRA